ncbi:SF0329 family protein [Massilia brevitalea]|uniref:SF0329 family protein n=1 Tax=Massilia brevitalea TaxID=442526 RepID=UPI002739EDB3|nr:hypothetical protein [Massilia brevitalea]
MQWSQLRKQLGERLAPGLSNRLDLNQTRYRHAHDQEGEFWMSFDKERIFSAGSLTYLSMLTTTVRAASDRGASWGEAYGQAWPIMEASGHMLLEKINKDLLASLSLAVEDMLVHANPVIRALALADKRFGKRRLAVFDAAGEHPLVLRVFQLRCQAEGVKPAIPASDEAGKEARVSRASNVIVPDVSH